jgi:glycosyltransferase involved in cell wall biosynthesis
MIPVISIIIPVYKVEKYLRRCLDSILAQTFTNFECILVDDGSPDNCPYICDEYAKKDNRITVIHKENMGVAAARDSGLHKSVGKFIMYVDSDDWIEPNTLELLYKKQQETDADIVLGNIRDIYSYGSSAHIHPEIIDNILPVSYFLLYSNYSLFAKLYKKSLFHEYIVPDTYTVGEDLIVNSQIFSAIQPKKLQKVNEIIYFYDRTANGIMEATTNSIKHLNSYLDSPNIKCRLWVEDYLNKEKQDILVKIACLYLVYEAMTQYTWRCKNVTKKEIEFFYENYHKKLANSERIKKMLFFRRIIIPIFYFSMPLGKAYTKVLNFLEYMKIKFGNFYLNFGRIGEQR